MKQVYVINSQGEQEPFSFRKVLKSARRAGASPNLAFEIASTIEKEVYPGIRTSEIFKRVKELLTKQDLRAGLRFNLKEGIRKLGPSGFPFEKYVAEIFLEMGFDVLLNQRLKGKCARYEIDFLAQKDKMIYVGECKYRVHPGERIDLKIALTNWARFLDLKQGEYLKSFKGYQIRTIIVTNAKFTYQLIKYAKCVGEMDLLGWKYPKPKGLEYIIESHKLYPITILPSFRPSFLEAFGNQHLMLVGDVLSISEEKLSQRTRISQKRLSPLIKEAKVLLGIK